MSALADLLTLTGLDGSLADWADLTGQEPVLPSSFRIGEATQASIAALGLAACMWSGVAGCNAWRCFGSVQHIRHAARLPMTPAFWSRPAEPLCASPAAWTTG